MKFVSDIAVLPPASPFGGQAFPAATSIQEALGTMPQAKKSTLFIWKSVLVASMLLFSLTASPLTAALEKNLTSENILAVLNDDRSQNGLKPLQANLRLEEAARKKAEHILSLGYFAHTSPSGLAPWDFIRATGFDYSFAGENLAMNYSNVNELEADFLTSPAHRDNLRSGAFTDIGIAIVRGLYQGQEAVITVQMFGTPK